MAKRISIINFKGGVGKTTLAFHLATGLENLTDKRVLLVDLDHQSSLSILCLGYNRWDEVSDSVNTVDRIFLSYVDEEYEMPGTEIVESGPMYGYWVDVVPASLNLDSIEVELTSTFRGSPMRSEWNKRTLLCKWIEDAGLDDEYEYIIFDCPPATKIVSQNAVAASHGYIVPVVPEAVMQRGLPHLFETIEYRIDTMLKMLSTLPGMGSSIIYVPDTRMIGLAITSAKSGVVGKRRLQTDHSTHMNDLERHWSEYIIEPLIPETNLVSKALAANIPVYDIPGSTIENRKLRDGYIYDIYERLVKNIEPRISDL